MKTFKNILDQVKSLTDVLDNTMSDHKQAQLDDVSTKLKDSMKDAGDIFAEQEKTIADLNKKIEAGKNATVSTTKKLAVTSIGPSQKVVKAVKGGKVSW